MKDPCPVKNNETKKSKVSATNSNFFIDYLFLPVKTNDHMVTNNDKGLEEIRVRRRDG